MQTVINGRAVQASARRAGLYLSNALSAFRSLLAFVWIILFSIRFSQYFARTKWLISRERLPSSLVSNAFYGFLDKSSEQRNRPVTLLRNGIFDGGILCEVFRGEYRFLVKVEFGCRSIA